MNKHLSYETSRALYDMGVRLNTKRCFWFNQATGKRTDHYDPLYATFTNNQVPLAGKAEDIRNIPCPDLIELLDAMPIQIKNRSDVYMFGLHRPMDAYYADTKGWSASYEGSMITENESPVEACGLLLLKLYKEGLLPIN